MKSIEDGAILPSGTVFHNVSLSFAGIPNAQRRVLRSRWVEQMLESTARAEIVFVDPDRGIEGAGARRYGRDGPKYVYLDDLSRFWRREQSLIIDQHLILGEEGHTEIAHRSAELAEALGVHRVWSLRFRRGRGRVFILVPQRRNEVWMVQRLVAFARLWLGHFELIDSSHGWTDDE